MVALGDADGAVRGALHKLEGLPWPLYRDIFLYTRQKRIPLVGLNVPREIIAKVAREGYGSLTEAERKKPLTCTIDEESRALIRKTFTEHAQGIGALLRAFLRSTDGLGHGHGGCSALDYLDKNPGGRIESSSRVRARLEARRAQADCNDEARCDGLGHPAGLRRERGTYGGECRIWS